MERESSKERSVSFLWTNKSFLLWNCLSRNLTLFNQPRQQGFWRNLRYILYSMVKDSTFLNENFFFRYAKFHRNLCENLSLWDILKFLRKGINYAWTEDWSLCRQICYFLDVSGKTLLLTRFTNDPYKPYNQLNACRLAQFQKTQKRVNRGKMKCWALFVIS